MKSKKTAKELAEILANTFNEYHPEDKGGPPFPASWRATAEVAARELGVELAPEPKRPKLPEWAEEGLVLDESKQPFAVDVSTKGGKWLARFCTRETGRTWVEVHRRWLKAKRLLDREGFAGDRVRQILRGEDEP